MFYRVRNLNSREWLSPITTDRAQACTWAREAEEHESQPETKIVEFQHLDRSQYMEDSARLHWLYYGQFVTPETMSFVRSMIGLANLVKSSDPHLNDVPGVVRDSVGNWVWDRSPINIRRLRVCGESDTPSTRTCTGKAAARRLLHR